jgi:hypothetical protein
MGGLEKKIYMAYYGPEYGRIGKWLSYEKCPYRP